MNSKLVTPIIMAGGSGTRLWPLSREDSPKQFCDLGLGGSLFQNTLKRVQNALLFDKPVVVCSAKHESIVRMQAEEIGVELAQIICEPFGRNTAAAITLPLLADTNTENKLVLVLPSDHKIEDTQQFQSDVIAARNTATEARRLVLFGIRPNALETGFGYVRSGETIGFSQSREIVEFVEKPSAERVELLVQEPNVFWNSGMFFFSKNVFIEQMQLHAPDVLDAVQKSLPKDTAQSGTIYPDATKFANVPDISFDYAIMEKTNVAAICDLHSGWSDLGSWNSIWESKELDKNANALSGNVIDSGSKGCLISSDGPVVGTCGLEDIVVVANKDAVLVSHKNNSQNVKDIVATLKTKSSQTIKSHSGETRPWGKFESLDRGESHQVKRITVEPSGRLSLQYHFHRSEHWVVVKGIATVTVDDEVKNLGPCQQIFIPQGAVHRLENYTDEPVEIIEVQYGSYLGEDDIVRVEDVYDRPANETSNICAKAG